MSDFQIANVYFHERDKEGRILPKEIPQELGQEEAFRHVWRQRGFPEGTIDKLWAEKIAREPQQNPNDRLRAELLRKR